MSFLNLFIRKNGSFIADVSLYASTDQTADNIKSGSEEKLIDVNLALTDTEKSGAVVSTQIKNALNNKQPKFVIGGENLSASPLSSHNYIP